MHHLEVTVRQAQGGDTGRLRPRVDAQVTPPATTQTRAAQRAGAPPADRRDTRAEAVTVAAQPAVNISIGRIEVRAIPAPSPPAVGAPGLPSQPKGPTLAEYLRGDDGRPR
ncbi:hypothetical protein AB0M35_20330 [Micromonospora sp. NPDC051196]|uniref:hypothetical protein n=1 Tax=Micromonospora sp. NPDC051196 TaxID=3155281 RepID=UPI003426ED46